MCRMCPGFHLRVYLTVCSSHINRRSVSKPPRPLLKHPSRATVPTCHRRSGCPSTPRSRRRSTKSTISPRSENGRRRSITAARSIARNILTTVNARGLGTVGPNQGEPRQVMKAVAQPLSLTGQRHGSPMAPCQPTTPCNHHIQFSNVRKLGKGLLVVAQVALRSRHSAITPHASSKDSTTPMLHRRLHAGHVLSEEASGLLRAVPASRVLVPVTSALCRRRLRAPGAW